MSDEHEDRGPGWPYADPAQGEFAGFWEQKRRLAAAMRRTVGLMTCADIPEQELSRLADTVERLADRLASFPRTSRTEGYSESANAGRTDALFDHSPVIGLSNPLSAPLRLWRDGERTGGSAVYGDAYEGPPGCLHGGFVAAAFDELLGFAQSVTGAPGMTARLIVQYRKPTPLATELRFDAGVDKVEGRKIYASGTVRVGDEVTAEAEGLFVSVNRDQFASVLAANAERVGRRR
jgi:hypothetical protein